MTVMLSPELERLVKEQLAAGRFLTADEVVREALFLLAEQQNLLDDLDSKIDAGLADAAAGRTYCSDEARELLRSRRAARATHSRT